MGNVLDEKRTNCSISACNRTGDSRASVKKACSHKKFVLKTLVFFSINDINLETKIIGFKNLKTAKYILLVSINTLELCRGADSTFVTYDGRHESLIDHIIIPIEKLPYVSRCDI